MSIFEKVVILGSVGLVGFTSLYHMLKDPVINLTEKKKIDI
jgi:hypothetical protein